MKTFYCIVSHEAFPDENPNVALLRAATEAAGVAFEVVSTDPNGMLFSALPELGEGGLYVLNVQSTCRQLAFGLLKKNPHLKHLYLPRPLSIEDQWGELINDEAAGLPVIPTLYSPPNFVTDELLDVIESKLGGFPVILKEQGGSHGTGVMVIDSAVSLKTVLPHVVAGNSYNFVLKKFMKDAAHYRVVVLDGEVLSTTQYLPQEGDIRTNAVKNPSVEPAVLRPEWQEIAIHAVMQKGVVFGGVDLLIDPDGQAFIAEVNTPCNFSRNQHLTGDPIAEKLVAYLTT